jgi:hypothetical protein
MQEKGAVWNPAIQLFEFPLEKAAVMTKAIHEHRPKVNLKEAPLHAIKEMLKCSKMPQIIRPTKNSQEHRESSVQRVIVLDPFMHWRYSFALKHLFGTVNWQRSLLVCSSLLKNSWTQFFRDSKVEWTDISYRSLQPEAALRAQKNQRKAHEVEIMTYEQM